MIQEWNGIKYDDNMYEVCADQRGNEFLRASEGFAGKFVVPEGFTDLSGMFKRYHFNAPDQLCEFDTSNVTRMREMFCSCKMPKGFTLGDKFDTSNVTDMSRMFCDCRMSEGFSLGDKFNTSNVTDMFEMFEECDMPKGFTLGDKFNTSNVTDMSGMFWSCTMPKGFTLGDKFDTSQVVRMNKMFQFCRLPEGFSLGYKFNTSNVTQMKDIFKWSVAPNGAKILSRDDKQWTCGIIQQLREPTMFSSQQERQQAFSTMDAIIAKYRQQ